ncbi:MAG: flagellar L-ring protein precursor FlgH [Sulfurimonas sp.]|jgi:flagellar L-ring protein precursor FlgH|uniref:flagellar basal body L-ring protein FlgH n=1 Tax=Sulfurimonas sp. TaxID=2022749 RepID=UPI0039E596BC
MIKNLLTTMTLFCAILFLNGCTAGLTEPEINFEPPPYVEQMPAKEDKRDYTSTGSIFGQGENPLFSDHKAMHKHDIVTVIISEAAQSSSTAAKALTEDDTMTLGGGVFTSPGANGAVNSAVNTLNGFSNIGFGSTSGSAFSGAGSATNDASFTTTVSARIVKVLSNGNYFISGSREILIDKQKQIIKLSGVIRPYDIDQNNNINSAQMSEAKILYKTQGDIDRATEQGWGTKIIQAAWPF